MIRHSPALLALLGAAGFALGQPADACVQCHADAELFPEERLAIVRGFETDVHRAVGIGCADCHGGNPDPSLADDMAASMDPGFRLNPYRGAPARAEIPGFCGRCHSDPGYMKRFKPDARVDQEQEYWTSHHGTALRKGDLKVATCIDCHGTHGILAAGDARSAVYPSRVAETCSRCHSDTGYMEGYRTDDGRPLPVDQFALWQVSVHGRSMLEREDLSAPTCNDCHGNHGATPPGLDSITFVCGQCHGREAGLFRGSKKHAGFETHNEILADSDAPGCDLCHQVPAALSELPPIRSFGECTTCHGNHGIVRPTLAMFSPLPETPCAFCHEDAAVLPDSSRPVYEEVRNELLAEGRRQGKSEALLFDWLVDQSLLLPQHTLPRGDASPQPRPEFGRLFAKFRIGKTHFAYTDPVSGEETSRPVIRCSLCHLEPGEFGAGSGAGTAEEFVSRIRGITAVSAQAERVLLRARRGGVETRPALELLDQAVDSQIELQVLVHSFDSDPESSFHQKYEEGLAAAQQALAAGHEALGELGVRRRGLIISLSFIVLLLIALGLKIRQLED